MSWFTSLFAGGASDLIDKVGGVIDNLHLSGEEKQNFKLELQQVIAARDSELEQTLRKNLEAKERIIVAELAQGDSFTKRARPSVVYFGLVMIGLNYFVLPLALLVSGNFDKMQTCSTSVVKEQTITNCYRAEIFPLPGEFWAAWGGIVATWAVGRSFEKAGFGGSMSKAVTGNKRISLFDDDTAAG